MLTLRAPARGPFRLPQSQPCRRPETSGEFHLTASHSTPWNAPIAHPLPVEPYPFPALPAPSGPTPSGRSQKPVGNPSLPLQPSPPKSPALPQPEALPEPSQSPPCQPPPHPHPHPPPHPPVPAPPATGGGGGQDFVALHREVRVQTGKLFIPKRRWDVRRPSGARQGGY